MASAVMDNAKAFANEHLATLRVKLNQIPALQEVEVRECPALNIRVIERGEIQFLWDSESSWRYWMHMFGMTFSILSNVTNDCLANYSDLGSFRTKPRSPRSTW